jgi:hypothetical protein
MPSDCSHSFKRGLGQRVTDRVVTSAADRRRLHLDRQTVAGQRAQHAHRLLGDLGSDSITRQNGNLHLGSLFVR